MSYDFKKEQKQFYNPKQTPTIIEMPKMHFIAVEGQGNPNHKEGEYPLAIEALYGVAYTLKMSYKNNYPIEGFFDYVVPPLEGFWWQEEIKGVNYANKDGFKWISIIRLPDFIKETDVEWAKQMATQKKKKDFSKVQYFEYEEGLSVQCMHLGSFDEEPVTVAKMDQLLKELGYVNDITDTRYHHEIYLTNPQKSAPEKWKTVIRHPIKKID